ncbi:single-stranded DNA-binding protein [Photorhabdus bodei]|uniref:Single-stranded DNA-binding protein n=1 Tax=Photorhabdus bodei TaxID=2029681 RepID=A0AAW6BMF2_9GAMM|nr:single-stranded DNA-binding protein [Photorhabdus bodei]MDB6373976.1 single-stranded DNA-binding protein [Photorhabdus bodei]
MQARARGIVAIKPKYIPAKDNVDSHIIFRLRCDFKVNSNKIAEFYTIKAFGKVADFLRDQIKKDSKVYIEALARARRYKMHIEFHAFMVHVLATGMAIDTRIDDAKPFAFTETKNETPATTTECTHSPEIRARVKTEMTWQEMSDDDVAFVANKFRSLLAFQKSRINESANGTKSEPVMKTVSQVVVSATPIANQRLQQTSMKQNATSSSPTATLLNAREALRCRQSSVGSDHFNGNYADIRS